MGTFDTLTQENLPLKIFTYIHSK